MIDIRNLSKSYNKGTVKAVDDLCLTVHKGEIFGFLGPNGAGKTTTIKMMVGLLKPDAGTILINGVDNRVESLRCKAMTTYVPDNPDVYERLTGMEYRNFIGDVFSVPKDRRVERVSHWAEIFEMASSLQNFIQSYSHGMRQKIVLMGALLPRVDLMVLDGNSLAHSGG